MSACDDRTISRRGASRLAALLELGKLRLSTLAIVAVLAGIALGAQVPLATHTVVLTGVGTLLVAVAGNALNMLIERERDKRMARTAGRPLPTGRLLPIEVAGFGIVCAVLGLAALWFGSNPLATALCATILFTYVLVYTPLKPVTTLNTLVGAVPGALPPVVGYAAAAGYVDTRALALFLILFFWQIPHFLAIAWRYREDYRRGGMRMLSVVDPKGRATAVQMIVYTLALLIVSLWPPRLLMTGDLYPLLAILLGVFFLVPVVVAAARRTDAAMRGAFLASIVYLPLLLGAMLLDRP
ncbi:MAG: heme o synthase [Planctomycetota bacterium]